MLMCCCHWLCCFHVLLSVCCYYQSSKFHVNLRWKMELCKFMHSEFDRRRAALQFMCFLLLEMIKTEEAYMNSIV
uniref:Uncharacterized protein n=2 Tax=Aegilops tauschii subsp. strangulata TaxID=200361 RepID=A0A453LI41_AEGTS